MDKLHENIAAYVHSGSAPCVKAATGDGHRLVLVLRAAKEKTGGAPIDIILATEGSGWDMETTCDQEVTKNLAAAQEVRRFRGEQPAYELYGKFFAIVGYPGDVPGAAELSADADAAGSRSTLARWAWNARILAEWTKRYDSKSAPSSTGFGAPA